MKKQTRRRARPAVAPMLVTLSTVPEYGLTERQAVEAMAGGWATTYHFDDLADCRNMLTLAASDRGDSSALAACEIGLHALIGIKDRHEKTGKFGASGEELKALRAMVDSSEDFWRRQSGSLFAKHYDFLKGYTKCKNSA